LVQTQNAIAAKSDMMQYLQFNNRRKRFWVAFIVGAIAFACLTFTPVSRAQDAEIPPAASASPAEETTREGLYFADVSVRGRPLFQIGSLAEISARDRAQIINRRLNSLVAQDDTPETVTVSPDNPNQIATLRVNNRVIMTVTQQDAEDFGTDVETLANRWAEQISSALDKPPFAVDVSQRLYGTIQQLLRDTITNLPSLIGAIIVVFITWIVARIVRFIAFRWAQQTEGDSGTELLIGRLSYGGVWVLGVIIALGVLGLDFATLLGALGLTSVAIGFSLKDVLSNYISGVILLASRPFRINDQVVIDNYEGTVTQVQLRTTTITTYDGRVLYIPTQKVSKPSIPKTPASPRRRSSVMVGIDYGANIEQAKAAIFGVLDELFEVESKPKPDILVNELAASTVNLEVRFWVDSRRAGYLTTTSRVTQAIKEALEKENIEMPTDIYTLVFRNPLATEKPSLE
jgi:small conductance mechanosensitive channel